MKKEIEALLFMSDKSIPITEFTEFYNISNDEFRDILKELQEEKKDEALNIIIKNGFVSIVTNPKYGEVITKFFNPSVRVKKLSKSSMETLTIIAFKGPMTKSEIEDIKGVSVDSSVQLLLEKKLIVSNERRKSVGNPKLYEVTENFYGYIGLENREELMNLDKAQWLSSLNKLESENDIDEN
ncbi:SMC-Scp complex subunit ScpB [Oceanivirga salmonicida]|uniref:SMC-Scp complex subunit ScpB n=1 Tax=Oceanivirga salmonicida TaxID=1769291 RepID=UPI00082D69D4|nr:SMC-Scp complex subunit ScpB [Oceanivirga salmonicida]